MAAVIVCRRRFVGIERPKSWNSSVVGQSRTLNGIKLSVRFSVSEEEEDKVLLIICWTLMIEPFNVVCGIATSFLWMSPTASLKDFSAWLVVSNDFEGAKAATVAAETP